MSPRSTKLFSALRLIAIGAMRLTLTIAVLAGVGLAIVSGREVLAERAADRPVPDAAPATPVAASRIAIQPSHDIARTFSGQVEARQQTDLAFELSGLVQSITVREGDFVEAGDTIAMLDTRLLRAERARLIAQRAAIMAEVELARRTNTRQVELLDRGFATAQTVDDTSLGLARLEAEIAGIDASLEIVDINLAKSALQAPFDGYVAARVIDAGAVIAPGTPVVQMLERAAPRFRVGLDPTLAAALTLGQTATVSIGGVDHTVTLAHLSPELDPTSRTRIAFFDFPADIAAPAAGETGEITLTATVQTEGAWVPLSALRQGSRGTWTLMVIRDEGLVIEAAEIIHLDADAAFVRGTFRDGDLFVPGGTHRVVPGQRIEVTEVIAWAH